MERTPEQTLSDLLELGEKATEGEWIANNMAVGLHAKACAGYPPTPGTIASLFDGEYIENGNYKNDATFIAASKNALPAIREYMEEVKSLREVLSILEGVAGFLENAPIASGVCCCGNPIEGHGYENGHAPVDHASYSASCWAEEIRAALSRLGGK